MTFIESIFKQWEEGELTGQDAAELLVRQLAVVEDSLDRECPACGLVQPDDDSSNCWVCGAILDLDDIYYELD